MERPWDKGLRELRRVSRGAVVILTFDGDALDGFWLADYVPELIEVERRRYPPIEHICEVLGGTSSVATVPIPIDAPMGSLRPSHARPELSDPAVRRSQSAWGFVPPGVEDRAIGRLTQDLATGEWDRRHGTARTEPVYLDPSAHRVQALRVVAFARSRGTGDVRFYSDDRRQAMGDHRWRSDKGPGQKRCRGWEEKNVRIWFSDRYTGLSKSVERETVPELVLLGTLPLGSAAVPLPHPTGWRAVPVLRPDGPGSPP